MVSANTSNVKYAGVPIDCGNLTLFVPPLTCGQFRKNVLVIYGFTSDQTPTDTADLDKILDDKMQLIHLALLRNYPEITLEEVYDLIGIDDVSTALSASVGRSMSEKVKSVGELKPVAPLT